MKIPNYSLSDIFFAWMQEAPQGLIWDWTTEQNSTFYGLMEGLCASHFDVTTSAMNMISESFPATATSLISDWQNSLGLDAGSLSLSQQQNAVVAKLTATGGASEFHIQNFIALTLGIPFFDISITTYFPAIAGFSRSGVDTIWQSGQQFYFDVVIPASQSSQIAYLTSELQNIVQSHLSFSVSATGVG